MFLQERFPVMFTTRPDPIEVTWTMGHWSIFHCGQALASYESECDARRAVLAIERLRPKQGALAHLLDETVAFSRLVGS